MSSIDEIPKDISEEFLVFCALSTLDTIDYTIHIDKVLSMDETNVELVTIISLVQHYLSNNNTDETLIDFKNFFSLIRPTQKV